MSNTQQEKGRFPPGTPSLSDTYMILYEFETIMNESNGDSPTVLVGGATGNQGGAVAGHLLDSTEFDVRVLTRSPGSSAARDLSDRGATIRQGDLLDRESLERALSGVDRAFFITDYSSAGSVEDERTQGFNMIDAAESEGVDHLVYSSTVDADVATDVPHFEAKHRVETRLLESAVAGTILRPSSFYQNFDDVATAVHAGFLPFPIATGSAVPMFDVRDMGKAATEVLADPASHAGEVHNVCAGLYTLEEIADIMSSIRGIPITPISLPTAVVRMMEDESVARTFDWYNRHGKARETPETTLDIELTDIETYLQRSKSMTGDSLYSVVGRLKSIPHRSSP